MPLKSVGSFTATADPGLGPGARVAIFIMRFLGCAGALGSERAGARGSGARVIATEGPVTEAAAATTGFAIGFSEARVTIGFAEARVTTGLARARGA